MSEMEWFMLWFASGFALALISMLYDWWAGEDLTLGNLGGVALLTLGGFAPWIVTILAMLITMLINASAGRISGDTVILRGRRTGRDHQ